MKQRYFPTFNQYLNEQEVNEAIFDPALLQEFNSAMNKIKSLYKKIKKHQDKTGMYKTEEKYGGKITIGMFSDDESAKEFVLEGSSVSKKYNDLFFVFTEDNKHRTYAEFMGNKGKLKNKITIYDCVLGNTLEFRDNAFYHEMVHYKDYVRNQHKFSKGYDIEADGYQKYISTPHEFLAHTQETIMKFSEMFISLPNGVPDTIEEFMKLLDTHKELSRDDIFDKKYRKKYRKNIYKLWKELKNNAMAYKLIFNIVKGKLPTDMDTSKLIQAIKQIQDNDSEFIINWKRKHFKRTLSKLKKAHDNGDFFDFNDDSDELDIVLQQAR